jgi:predicted ATP-dependent endonuclease of OLD family
MKFKKFIIENYQAIEKTEVVLNDNLIPIIGINEYGKTTVLKAILSFDNRKDNYLIEGKPGDHLNPYNLHDLPKNQKKCCIKAEIIFETEDEINLICEELKIQHTDQLKAEMLKFLRSNKTILISRTISVNKKERIYSIENIDVPKERNEEIAEKIVNRTSPIIYLSDYHLTLSPEQITFPAGYFNENWKPGRSKYQSEWRALLEQIFYEATEGQYTLKDYIKSANKEKNDIKRRVEHLLNSEIINKWSELGQIISGNDNFNLELTIDYQQPIPPNNEYQFSFKVIDKSKIAAGSEFNIWERSKGFKWFFNFIFKIKYNSDYLDDQSRALFLLDEPGSFLHSSAQEKMLSQLVEYSQRNPIIFCTHSQYFLNPTKINISKVKVVSKENGKIYVKNFDETGVSKSVGALTPVFHALHLNTGVHIFEGSKIVFGTSKIVITEGITDFYFFDMLLKYTEHIKDKSIKFFPGASSGELKELISIAITSSDKYLVLLDSDNAGINAYNRYKKFFGEEQAKNFYCYEIGEKKEGVELEHFLSKKDVERLKEISECSSGQKNAIISLYHCKNEEKIKSFICNLDQQTIDNLAKVLSRINEMSLVESKGRYN